MLGEISTSFLVLPLNILFHHLTLIFKSFFHSSQNPSFRMYYLPNPENCKKNFKVIFCFLNPVSPRVRVFCLFSYISFILVVLSLLFTYASLGIFQCQIQKNDRWCGITVQLCIHLASVGFPEPFWDFLGKPVSCLLCCLLFWCGFLQLVPRKTSPIHLTKLLTSLICWWPLPSFFNMTNLYLLGILKP